MLAKGHINHGSCQLHIFFLLCYVYIHIPTQCPSLFFLFPQIVNVGVFHLYCRMWDDNLIDILNKL